MDCVGFELVFLSDSAYNERRESCISGKYIEDLHLLGKTEDKNREKDCKRTNCFLTCFMRVKSIFIKEREKARM